MKDNPYKFTGSLYPVKDHLVYVPRERDVDRVIKGIKHDEYWAILGPRQIGKTTFLRQLERRTKDRCVIVDFTKFKDDENDFYRWLIQGIFGKEITRKDEWIPGETICNPLTFLDFLRTARPKDDRRVILLFDEIEVIPDLYGFLHLWRTYYEDLKLGGQPAHRYGVVITGSVDLVKATYGTTSPLNTACIHYLKDFSDDEAGLLIENPMSMMGITVDKGAKTLLMSKLLGHPTLIQESCHKLVEMVREQRRTMITEEDIDSVINILFKESLTFDQLRSDFESNSILRQLICSILKGEKDPYDIYKEFSVWGAGAIVEDRRLMCAIRNPAYREFLEDLIKAKYGQKMKPAKKFPGLFKQ